MLGYENTLSVTMDEMLHHARAVRRGVRYALVMADMPYGAYHTARETASAMHSVCERVGAETVKIEGGAQRVPTWSAR